MQANGIVIGASMNPLEMALGLYTGLPLDVIGTLNLEQARVPLCFPWQNCLTHLCLPCRTPEPLGSAVLCSKRTEGGGGWT